MYENLVFQDVTKLLIKDINSNSLPGAILFSGEESSGKLSAALETSRILSCSNRGIKSFNCECTSCLQSKALTTNNLMLLGPRDCFLEIQAAKQSFLNAYKENASYLNATRYLFLRSIRKLTLRFNPILWKGDSDLSKIAVLLDQINENLELLDFPRELPDFSSLEKLCDELVKDTTSLENSYLYASIPVSQIRNLEDWCRIKSEEGKKTIIIENADRMLESVRNALLKILEEPPADCIFILLTSKRNAIMQTILSRVRTYNFKNRLISEQQSVIKRVFHNEYFNGSINDYLLTFLPVSPLQIKEVAKNFIGSIVNRNVIDCSELNNNLNKMVPKKIFNLFLIEIINFQKKLLGFEQGVLISSKVLKSVQQCWDNYSIYNLSSTAALEILYKELSILNAQNGGILKICL
ncbi:MAG: DNA polymerase III [Treponema sp.]|nr:DNA polymerase III [Treponema sp.]